MPIFETYSDLIPSFKFIVEIPGFGSINFLEVNGLGMRHRTVTVQPGGEIMSQELYTGTEFDNVVLRRGLSSSQQLWDFVNHPLRAMQALSNSDPEPMQVSITIPKYKTDIVIKQLDLSGLPVKKWILKNAWAKEYKLDNLSAADSQISIESLTLSHSGIIFDNTSILEENLGQGNRGNKTSVTNTNNGDINPGLAPGFSDLPTLA